MAERDFTRNLDFEYAHAQGDLLHKLKAVMRTGEQVQLLSIVELERLAANAGALQQAAQRYLDERRRTGR
jgi:hypothetical protein